MFSRHCAIGLRRHHRHPHVLQLFWPKSLRKSPPPRCTCPCAEACPHRITSAIPVAALACDLERHVRHPVAPPRPTVRGACCGVATQGGPAHPTSGRDRRTDRSAPPRVFAAASLDGYALPFVSRTQASAPLWAEVFDVVLNTSAWFDSEAGHCSAADAAWAACQGTHLRERRTYGPAAAPSSPVLLLLRARRPSRAHLTLPLSSTLQMAAPTEYCFPLPCHGA